MKFTLFIFSILLFFLTGCNTSVEIPADVNSALDMAKNNRKELQKVIDHYQDSKDFEKLEAAFFIIKNLPGRTSFYDGQVFNPIFDRIVDTLAVVKKDKKVLKMYNLFYNEFMKAHEGEFEFYFKDDITYIESDYIIDNIDLAFEAYEKVPIEIRCSKDQFYNYVLPYSMNREPLEKGLRRKLYGEYQWVYDEMKAGVPLEKTVCGLLESLELKSFSKMKYPGPVPLSQVKRVGFSNCDNMVALSTHILRSIGIPATMDLVTHWGNHYKSGHGWLVFFNKDGVIAIDPIERNNLVNYYHEESIPKVYRREFKITKNSFTSRVLDVTNVYQDPNEIVIPVNSTLPKGYKLKVFDTKSTWSAIAKSFHYVGDNIVFPNLGNKIIYALTGLENDSIYGSPFYLGVDMKRRIFKPNFDKSINAVLTRKYPQYYYRQPEKINWIKSINGAKIYGANREDFSDALQILEIKDFSSSNPQFIKNMNKRSFKYYKLIKKDPNSISIADFNLLDDQLKTLTSDVRVSKLDGWLNDKDKLKVVDQNPITYLMTTSLTVIYALKKPMHVDYFRVHARNDDNNIRPGDEYELMYWDKHWQSAGKQIAKDTLLRYINMPSETVYRLKNNTRGREEHLFFLDDKGQQLWPGVNYPYDHFSNTKPPSICN